MSQRLRRLESTHLSSRTRVERATLDGQAVLVKSVAADLPNAADVAAFHAEHALHERLAGPGLPELVRVEDCDAIVMRDTGHVALAHVRLPLGEALDVAERVARVLARLHDEGLVHGDVNPSNVVRRASDGDVLLIDLGVAHAPLDAAAAAARGLVGSVEYMAPEQTGRTSRGIDARADLYALGATLFDWLTGLPPFVADDVAGYAHAHLSKEPPALQGVPAVVNTLVGRLLAKDPDQRYQTASGLADDLATCRARLAEGGIAPFELGTTDGRGIRLPSLLLQRDDALAALVEGRGGVVVVSGAQGLGKSALVAAARRRLEETGRRVIAVPGRAPTAAVPLAAITRLLASVSDALLDGSPDELARRRVELQAAVAPNGAVLVELQPRLEEVIGAQPKVAELGPRESELRRVATLEAFLSALGAPVLVVDDAERVDPASLRVLAALAGKSGLRLVATVERWDDECALARGMAALPGPRASLSHVALEPLDLAGVGAFLEAALAAPAPERLVRVVHAKTGGNPSSIGRLLTTASTEGILRTSRGAVVWDEAALFGVLSARDVVEGLLLRLAALEQHVRDALTMAACLGDEVDATLLRAIASGAEGGRTAGEASSAQSALDVALAAGVLVQMGEGRVAFAHARLRARLKADARPEVWSGWQLAAARARTAALTSDSDPGWFAVAEHYASAGDRLTDADRLAAFDAERRAAAIARVAGGNDVAALHLERAQALADASPDLFTAEQRRTVARDRVEQVLLSGDGGRAQALAVELVARLAPGIERARARRLEASALMQQGNLLEGITAIRAGLHELGIELPDSPQELGPAIDAGLARMQASLAATPPAAIAALPEVTDPVVVEAMGLLFQLIPAAFQTFPPLFVVAELTMLDLTLTHGVTPQSSKNLVDCGIIAIKVFHDHARALELADASFALLDRFAPTPLAAAVKFVYGTFIAPWRESPTALAALLADAERVGHALGDKEHASYAASWRGRAKQLFGHPLPECTASLEEAQAGARAAGVTIPAMLAVAAARSADALAGRSTPPTDEDLESMQRYGDHAVLGILQTELVRAYVMRDAPRAAQLDARLGAIADVARGVFTVGEFLAFRALQAAWRLTVEPEHADADVWRASLAAADAELDAQARINPTFFGPFAALVRAERLRIEGAGAEAIAAAYDAATEVSGAPWLQVRAIACERHAELWLAAGRVRLARPLLKEAHSLYERWGAIAKLAQLERAHPDALAHEKAGATRRGRLTDPPGVSSVDVATIVKAVSAIASEVKVERLYATLLVAIIENAGARRGCLIGTERGTSIEALAVVGEPVTVGRVPLDETTAVAREVVRHVVRTGEDVILESAVDDERFRRDPHIARERVRSLMCIAIRHAGETRGALYVENAIVAGAFTRRHVEILRILAGQAATSMENARMYAMLEEKVEERTRELAARSREILALLDHVPQGIFTFGADLRVEERFSTALPTVLGTRDIVGRDVMELLFDGATLPPEAKRAHETSLRCSFGLPGFMAEVNWSHLVRAYRVEGPAGVRSLEVDWATITSEAGDVVRILASVRDVTALRALEAELAHSSFRAETIDQVLEAGLPAFDRFVSDARTKLARCRSLAEAPVLSRAALDEVLLLLHTLKGNGRVLGLARFASVLHRAEELFARARSGEGAHDVADLRAALDGLAAELSGEVQLVDDKLGPIARGGARASAIARAVSEEIARSTRDGADPAECFHRIVAVAATASADQSAETVGAVVEDVARVLSAVAGELGKPIPTLTVRGDAALDPPACAALGDVLGHVFRNAVDHGIEHREERIARGKSPEGVVEVEVHDSPSAVRIEVRDDGRGLPMSKLRARAGDAASDTAIAESIFASGVSTAAAVTEISGRGVGMCAVRGIVADLGGTVAVALEGEEHDGHRPFALAITLPRPIARAA